MALALATLVLTTWCFFLLLNPPFAVLVAVLSGVLVVVRRTLGHLLE